MDYAIVALGDSITHATDGGNEGTASLPTPVGYLASQANALGGGRAFYAANGGISSTTSDDWLPTAAGFQGGAQPYAAAAALATGLQTAHPTARMMFSIMLDTNDTNTVSNHGAVTGRALTGAEHGARLTAIVTRLLSDWPGCLVVIHHGTYYTANLNGYGQAGLDALATYVAANRAVVASFAGSNPGQVFVGDEAAYAYFQTNYLTELRPQTDAGSVGTWYLHPSGLVGSGGRIGNQSLGNYWATAILAALAPVAGARAGKAILLPNGKLLMRSDGKLMLTV